jgi:hypothetical protein
MTSSICSEYLSLVEAGTRNKIEVQLMLKLRQTDVLNALKLFPGRFLRLSNDRRYDNVIVGDAFSVIDLHVE